MIRLVGCWEEPGRGSGQTCHYHARRRWHLPSSGAVLSHRMATGRHGFPVATQDRVPILVTGRDQRRSLRGVGHGAHRRHPDRRPISQARKGDLGPASHGKQRPDHPGSRPRDSAVSDHPAGWGASFLEYGVVRRKSVAWDVIPRRARSTTRRGGTTAKSTAPKPIPATRATRFNAATSAFPVRSTGPRRSNSNAENRRSPGTSTKSETVQIWGRSSTGGADDRCASPGADLRVRGGSFCSA